MALRVLSQRTALVGKDGLMQSSWFTLIADIVRAINRLDSGSTTTINSAGFSCNGGIGTTLSSAVEAIVGMNVLNPVVKTGSGIDVTSAVTPVDFHYFSGLDVLLAYKVSFSFTATLDEVAPLSFILCNLDGDIIDTVAGQTADITVAGLYSTFTIGGLVTGHDSCILRAVWSGTGTADLNVSGINASIIELGTAV